MMKIGIDANEVLHGERAIRRYAVNLILSLTKLASAHRFRLLYFRFREPIHVPLQLQADSISSKTIPLPGRLIQWSWKNFGFPKPGSMLGPLDLFHAPGAYVPPRGRIPLVVTVHGMHHQTIPQLLNPDFLAAYRLFMDWCLKQADYFITVSEGMRADFLETYRVPGEKVRAIPLGVHSDFRILHHDDVRSYLKKRFGIQRRYLLYVGGIQRHKNVPGILRAFRSLKDKKNNDLQLVLAGNLPPGAEEIIGLIRELKLQEDVKVTGYLSQESEDLVYLYNGAEVFVFPSFYEGWASPPLEAMKCGVPVVASGIPSLRENLGEAALFVRPEDPEDIAAKIQLFLDHPELRSEYRGRGLNHVQPLTWDQMAQQTLQFYEDILSAKSLRH